MCMVDETCYGCGASSLRMFFIDGMVTGVFFTLKRPSQKLSTVNV